MIIKEEDYLKHSGVKGMKWDEDKKKGVTAKHVTNPSKRIQEEAEAIKKKIEDYRKSKNIKSSIKKLNVKSITSDLKDITDDGIKQGKSFVDGILKGITKNKETVKKHEVGSDRVKAEAQAVSKKLQEYKESKSITNKLKNITTESVKKGKNFVDDIFNKVKK